MSDTNLLDKATLLRKVVRSSELYMIMWGSEPDNKYLRVVQTCSDYIIAESKRPIEVAHAYSRRANVEFLLRDYWAALADSSIAIDMIARHDLHNFLLVEPLSARSMINLQAGNIEAAQQDSSIAMLVSPTNAILLDNHGLIYKAQGDNKEAEVYFRKAFEFSESPITPILSTRSASELMSMVA